MERFRRGVAHRLVGKQVCHHDVAHGKLMGQVSIAFKKLVDGTNYLAVHAPASKTLVGQVRFAALRCAALGDQHTHKLFE